MRAKIIIPLILLTLLIPVTTAQEEERSSIAIQSLTVEPQKVFVGDSAVVSVTLYNPYDSNVKLSYVTVQGSGISYDSFELGYIPPESTHTISFSVKAKEAGIQNVELTFYTGSGTVKGYFTLFVSERMPELSFSENVKLGEVNNITLLISSPIEIENVVIDPLFDSEPDKIVLSSVYGVEEIPLKFYGENKEYEFRISFYSGINYHSYTVKLKPIFESGNDLAINVSSPQTSTFLYDVVELTAEITNLRDDSIYSLKMDASSNNGKVLLSAGEVAKLESGKSSKIKLLYSPEKSGTDVVTLSITYKDELGNEKEIEKTIRMDIQNKTALDVSGVEIETKSVSSISTQPRGMFGGPPSPSATSESKVEITVSGDVINRGFSEAQSVLVYLDFGGETEEYFIGKIEPSDSDSFSIPASGNERIVTVVVEWTNELGEMHTIHKTYQLNPIASPTEMPQRNPGILTPLNIAIIVAATAGILIYIKRRRRKE